MAKKNLSGYELDYHFEYGGFKELYSYEVPFEDYCEAIRNHFSIRLVGLDGTDNNIWKAVADFGQNALDNIFDEQQDWLLERCRNKAFSEFQDYVEYFLEENEKA